MTTGVLALQGAFALHQRRLESLGERVVQVRIPADLEGLDRLVVPGGESTTVSMLAERFELIEPLTEFAHSGKAVLGTCAGAILLSAEIQDGRADQRCLGAIDISTRRNGFGRQVDSFEQEVQIPVLGDLPFHAVCIRAPVIERVGESVTVLATIDSRPALVRSGAIMVSIFHPELVDDLRIHQLFLAM